MSSSDSDHIAPVTWLFGAQAETASAQEIPVPNETAQSVAPGPLSAETTIEPRALAGRFESVSNVSMYALARRGMSSREMREYLIGREFESTIVDDEIARLESVALLDDVALAETLVRTLRDRKSLGRGALTTELRRRKLADSAISSALDELDDDELARAIDVAIKRAGQLAYLDGATAKRRLGAFLMRRGYSGSTVSAAVSAALSPSSGPVFR
jgi:SOS response regulatory protein OraA/RecX